MKTIIVIAAHGAPATDCPRGTIGMFMALESMPRLVKRFGLQKRLPAARIVYAWPFDIDRVARMFADEIARFSS